MQNTYGCLIFVLATALISQRLFAADVDTNGAERCIPLNEIRRTEVIDDKTILFHVRNDRVYENRLPQRCIGLRAGNAIKYATSQSQLCNLDIISVMNQTTGTAVPGAACGLGLFVPIESAKKSGAN